MAKADSLDYILTATNASGTVIGTGELGLVLYGGTIASSGTSTFGNVAGSLNGGQGCTFSCVTTPGGGTGTGSSGGSSPYVGSISLFTFTFGDPSTGVSFELADSDAKTSLIVVFTNGVITNISYEGTALASSLYTGGYTTGGGLKFALTTKGQPATFGVLSAVVSGTADPSSPTVTAVTPEPSSLLLLATGLLGVAGAVKRRVA